MNTNYKVQISGQTWQTQKKDPALDDSDDNIIIV